MSLMHIALPSAVCSLALFVSGCAPASSTQRVTKAPETKDAIAEAAPASKSLAGMTRVPLIVTAQGSALVKCMVNGKPLVLILDTGAQSTVIDLRAAATANIRSHEVPGFYSRGVGAGKVAMRQGEVTTLDMSGFQAQVAPTLQDFSSLTLQHLATGSTPIVGLLGFDVLKSYNAVIDLKEGAMYLQKR